MCRKFYKGVVIDELKLYIKKATSLLYIAYHISRITALKSIAMVTCSINAAIHVIHVPLPYEIILASSKANSTSYMMITANMLLKISKGGCDCRKQSVNFDTVWILGKTLHN